MAMNLLIEYLNKHEKVTGKELSDVFDITDRAVRKQLSTLLKRGIVSKIGIPPKVFYYISREKSIQSYDLKKKVSDFVNKNYLYISPDGEKVDGVSGFVAWCNKTKQPIEKTALEYIKTFNIYKKYKKNDFIDGTLKLVNTFSTIGLDSVYYLDFYSIEKFGKTKLGQLLLYAKQSQNKKLMKEISLQIKSKIIKLIKKNKITSVGFIPPTVKREFQLMKVIQKHLNLDSKLISITKAKTDVAVPQKTLTKIEDRIQNARNTIIVDDNNKHKNILLIDDAVGSGSTLNETALQIKRRGICTGKIYGLAIVGSFKGFDVISEV